jgi:chemotaxis protein methyltransferase CheR
MITITDKEFAQLSNYIKANYGIYLKKEKTTLLAGRLQNVLQQAGFYNFSDYFQYLVSDKSGNALTTFVDKITTNHTFFMREADHFYFFRDQVLPYLAESVKDKDLHIWCAASSTGEESYTLAMIIDEFFGNEKLFWDTKILATDISEQVLEIAKKGIYSKERIAPLPAVWKSKYFVKHDTDNFILSDRIKNEVIYRKFNLVDSVLPFKKKFHTIFCRNVMIYFDQETKSKLIDRFYDQMEYGGYLFLGHSESLNRDMTRFKYIKPSVYRKE